MTTRDLLYRLDRMFGWLLAIGAAGHAYGTYETYPFATVTFVWSLSGSLAAGLLAAVNLLRVNRPRDATLAWISTSGCAAWLLTALAFGLAANSLRDARVAYHIVVAAVLLVFSLRSALGLAEDARR
jgi:hypothetical protein